MVILLCICVAMGVPGLALSLLSRNRIATYDSKYIISGGILLVVCLIALYFLTFKIPDLEKKNTNTYDATFVEARIEKGLLVERYIVVFEIDNKFYELDDKQAYYYFTNNDVDTIKVNLTDYKMLGLESNYITKIYYN